MNKSNSSEHLQSIERILINSIIFKTKINPEMDKSIDMKLKVSYLLNKTTFALQN